VGAGVDAFGSWVAIAVEDARYRLRWIPQGQFVMGAPKSEEGRFSDDGPQHEVKLSRGFWLGETPVPQAFWEAVMGGNPSYFKGARRPVECVSWEDCQKFCARLGSDPDSFGPSAHRSRMGIRVPSGDPREHVRGRLE